MIATLTPTILMHLADPSALKAIRHMVDNAHRRGPGNGIAVYENADLSHHQLGHLQFVSYGPDDNNMLVGAEAPERLPDIGSAIGWRYQIIGMWVIT